MVGILDQLFSTDHIAWFIFHYHHQDIKILFNINLNFIFSFIDKLMQIWKSPYMLVII